MKLDLRCKERGGYKLSKRLLICTHGRFGEEIIKSAEMIIGHIEDVDVVSLLPDMSPEDFIECVKSKLDPYKDESVICLVDLFGGTPSNMMARLTKDYHLQLITGLNLAMLIEIVSQRDFVCEDELLEIGLRALKESGKNVVEELNLIWNK